MIIGNNKNGQERPDIEYPCDWVYKVIGEDCTLLKDAIEECCAPAEVTITHSHASSKGKYHSLNAELVVQDEEQRLQIYNNLKASPVIKIVL
ncbi:MAG: cytoplasmic protein [Desulfobacterales bacterium]|nr:MAG: cytoplasmic protein [Desulfobacterales bacterium]